MNRKPSRRKVIAALGATAVPLAGCSSIGAPDTDTDPTDTPTDETATATGTERPSEEPPFERGEVLEDFEDLGDWGTILGSMEADTSTRYAGTQSVLVEGKGEQAGIYRSFPDGLDLTQNDLSVAMQLEKPANGKLSVDIYAPGARNYAVARRIVPKDIGGWIRFDLGYTSESRTPNMSSVQELRFVVRPVDGSDVKFRLDDLRLLPKQNEQGKVMLTFDDNFASHYEIAYKELKKRGWAGVSGTIPSEVNTRGRTGIGELREMQADGWDIISHPQIMNPRKPLPSMSEERQREVMEDTKEWLELKGFEDGARFFITPFDRMGDTTLDLVGELHELGFVFGACNNGVPPSGRHNISRLYGRSDAIEEATRMLKLAERRNQMTVLAFHDIAPDGELTESEFVSLLDTIEELDLDVVTASDVEALY